MAYTQIKKFGYRDSLDKGDPEKVIYGQDFDTEFEAIEDAFSNVPGGGGDPITPDIPGFEDVVFQTKAEDQQVVSKFTFAVDGQEPLTVENTGIWAGANYFRYLSAETTWKVLPGLEVEGDLNVSGETHLEGSLEVDGSTQLNADLNATGNISLDGNLSVGGTVEGDLTVNGNISIEGGGSIVYPDGTAGINEAPVDGSVYGRKDAGWEELAPYSYDDSWIQPALDGKANVGDSYTKAESDSTFIDDAPSDGQMYVRKDGRWELFTPPSAGSTYTAGNGITISGDEIKMSGSYSGTFSATTVKGG